MHLVGISFPHINDDARSKSHQIYKLDVRNRNAVFPTRIPQNFFRGSARSRGGGGGPEGMRKIQNIPRNIAVNIWPAVGNTVIIFMRYQLPLCFVLVCSYLRLYLVVLLQRLLTGGRRKDPRYQLFLACKRLHKWVFLEIRNIILGFPPWQRRLANTVIIYVFTMHFKS